MKKYDAFISYRHTELDKYVAETLHKQMESFKLPRNIDKSKLKREKIERVFRDQEELPLASNLEDPIVEALKNSEYLIVICSPRLKLSEWCRKEIETFIKLHGRKNILAVLIEGEPEDSFPEEILYEEQEIIDENGNKQIVRKSIEPLAADMRGADKKAVNKAMKLELLRLLAPMFGVSFDDLRQRHREQRIRKTLTISMAATAVAVAFGVYSTATAIRIRRQAELLAKQQSCSLAEDARDLYLRDNRRAAIETAYMALTEYEGVKLPHTPEAESALAEVLSVYAVGTKARAVYQYEFPGVVENIRLSPDENKVIARDNLGNIKVINVPERTVLLDISEEGYADQCGFIDDDNIYYMNASGFFKCVNIQDGSTIEYDSSAVSIFQDINITGDIVAKSAHGITVLDPNNLSEKYVKGYDDISTRVGLFSDGQTNRVYAQFEDGDEHYVGAINCENGELEYKARLLSGNITACDTDGVRLYVLSSDSEDLISGASYLTVINLLSGEVEYTHEYANIMADALYVSGAGKLLIHSWGQVMVVNEDTGDSIQSYDLGGRITGVVNTMDGAFSVYTSDGTCHVISPETEVGEFSYSAIVCSDVWDLCFGNGYIVATRNNDNRVIGYSYLRNAEAYEYTDVMAEPVLRSMDSVASAEYGLEKGIEKASFISSCIELPDSDLLVVSYLDESFETYRLSTMELLTRYTEANSGEIEYYGTVKGYDLIVIGYSGFLLDKEGKMHAAVPYMEGISSDYTCVVLKGYNDEGNTVNLASPIYDCDELIAKAKRNLDI